MNTNSMSTATLDTSSAGFAPTDCAPTDFAPTDFVFEDPARLTDAALADEAAACRDNHAAAVTHGEWRMAQAYWERWQSVRGEEDRRRRAEEDRSYRAACLPDPSLPCPVTGEPGESVSCAERTVAPAEVADYLREAYHVDASPDRIEFRLSGDLVATCVVTGNAAGVLCPEAGPGRTLTPGTLAAFAEAARQMWRLAAPRAGTDPYDCETVVASMDAQEAL